MDTSSGRPSRRWCHASVTLQDFAIVTWVVDPGLVGRLLPPGFEPDIRGGGALVSMVAFRDHRFHFRGAPFAWMSCGQVNYRTYVRRGGETGVWFVGFSLDSRLVAIPQQLWRMPWHRTSVDIGSSWSGDRLDRWQIAAEGEWGGAQLALVGTGGVDASAPGFADRDDASRVLFDPFVGWFARTDGSGIGYYSVWHEPLTLECAVVDGCRCDVFAGLGLIEAGQPPASAGVQRRIHFDVHTPPRRIPGTSPHLEPVEPPRPSRA